MTEESVWSADLMLSRTMVVGDPIGDSGRGFFASGISKSIRSVGVDGRGDIVGSTPRPVGETTSGECGLGHSLNKLLRVGDYFEMRIVHTC